MSTPTMSIRTFLKATFELAKPRITLLLLLIAQCSFIITGGFSLGGSAFRGFFLSLGSVVLLSIGIFTLNQWMERLPDGQMLRTRERPLPSNRFSPVLALAIGIIFTCGAVAFSFFLVNPAQSLVSVLTAAGYLGVYTPLKYRTAWHTALGALPGATPPLMGALAARGELDPLAWALFGILFFWQFPHFLSIEMIYKDDYAKAEIKVLPITDRHGTKTAFQVVAATLCLAAMSILPFVLGKGGVIYLILSCIAGGAFLALGFRAVILRTKLTAKHLLRGSVLYLPMIFLLLTAGL